VGLGNSGSTAKNGSKISAFATDTTVETYGSPQALSTALQECCTRRAPVAKFMILTEFRVAKAARLGECPAAKLPIQNMKDFP
jgi:hypothetical protein